MPINSRQRGFLNGMGNAADMSVQDALDDQAKQLQDAKQRVLQGLVNGSKPAFVNPPMTQGERDALTGRGAATMVDSADKARANTTQQLQDEINTQEDLKQFGQGDEQLLNAKKEALRKLLGN